MNKYISLEETPMGLKITLKDDGHAMVYTKRHTQSYDNIWKMLFKPDTKIAPREYFLLKPELVGALTGAPIVGKNITMDVGGLLHFQDNLKLWWFPDYMVMDEFDEMLQTGYIYFTRCD